VSPVLFGSYTTMPTAGTYYEITLNPDFTFQFTIVVATSTVTGDEYIQTGTYALNGEAITFTPIEASCPVVTAISTDAYAFNAAALGTVDSSSTATVWTTTTAAIPGPANLTYVLGCSPSTGAAWTPEPLAPVSN